jgi:hypothetical protein
VILHQSFIFFIQKFFWKLKLFQLQSMLITLFKNFIFSFFKFQRRILKIWVLLTCRFQCHDLLL